MSKLKERLANIKKSDELLIIVLSVSLSFTALFFTSAELFVRNQRDFIVDGWHIILPMFFTALAAAAAGILFLNLLLLIHDMLYIAVSRLLAGLLLALYIQELFLNGKMSSIAGTDVLANLKTWEEYADNIFFYLLTMLPLILLLCKEKYPNVKLFQIGKGYAVPYFAGLIFIMQAVGLAGSIAQFGFNRYERINYAFLSFEPTMSLSKEKNIVVFLTDRLDSFYMDELLENYPEMSEELDGFTFYQNNLSHYGTTFPSVVNMLTGLTYNGEEGIDYYEKAWADKMFADELKENGYHINLLIDNVTTYNSYNEIANRCDNLARLEEDEYDINFLRKNGIVYTMSKLSAVRIFPYSFKYYLLYGTADFSSNFVIPHNTKVLLPKAVGIDSDLLYYDYLTANGLTNDNSQNTFSFIHLNCAHDPSDDLEDLYDGEQRSGTFPTLATARGDFEIIFEYIRQMKEIGVYDNSTVIIIGDHGRPPLELETFHLDHLEAPIVTALLIKPEAGDRGPLTFDRYSELYNNYFAASVMEYAGLDHSEYGYSYNDIINNDLHFDRYYQAINDMVLGTDNSLARYKVTGDARDFGNWEKIS